MKNSVLLLASLLLIFSINVNSQWVRVANGMFDLRTYSLAANQTKIFAGTHESLSVSTNNGLSWYWVPFNAQSEPVYSILAIGETIICGVRGYGITVSADNGGYWTYQNPLADRTIYSLTYTTEGKLFAGVSALIQGGGIPAVYLSANNGLNFIQTSLINKTVYAMTSSGSAVFAGTQNEGIYITSNNGVNWSQTELNNQTVKSLASNGGLIFAGTTGNGVYISSDNGSSWIQTSLNNQEILSLAVNGNNIFAGTSSASNFFVSTNNGINWVLKNEGLGSVIVDAICIINNYIFAGTTTNGVYRRPLSELTSIQPTSNQIPNQFSLSQNYPNPFNPLTNIKFNIPLSRGVSEGRGVLLIIYDILGREVATLVNEQLKPGTYEVDWDATNYPSGTYFYKIISGEYTETRKAILIK